MQIIFFILLSVGYNIAYEVLRLFSFIGYIPYIRIIDIIGYYFVIISTLLPFSLMFRLYQSLKHQAGDKNKKDDYIRTAFLILMISFFAANILTYIETTPIEFGYFEFICQPILFYFMITCYLPFYLYLARGMVRLFKTVDNKKIRIQVRIVALFFSSILLERFFDLGGFYLYPVSFLRVIVEYTALFILLTIALTFILRERDFYDNLSSYFSVKSIYLMRKSGQMLFGYKFHEEHSEINFSSDQLLIGGFIYAISNGLKLSLNIEGDVLRISYNKPKDEECCEVNDCNYIYRGVAKRSFNLGYKISPKFDLSKAEAMMENGLLGIRIPFAESAKPKVLKIK